MTPTDSTEFSRLVAIDTLRDHGRELEIIATAEECQALAQRFDLAALRGLSAKLNLMPKGGGKLVAVSGCYTADVAQTCVVSLEIVENRLEADFNLLYALDLVEVASEEVMIDLDEEEPAEPILAGGIDLGEAVAQQLALALDPYPRAPGASLAQVGGQETAQDPVKESPFSILKGIGHPL